MREYNLPDPDTVQPLGSSADLGVMLAAHRAFRRDVTTLARAASRDTLRDPVRRVTVGTGWEVFRRQLLLHHQAEDAGVWPGAADPAGRARTRWQCWTRWWPSTA